jgi:outer membrane lipoprotein-sorting protein
MIKYRRLITLIVSVTYCTFAYQQPNGYIPLKSDNDFSVKLKVYATNLKTINSNFIQEKHLQYLDTELESGGVFWFKEPDKVRWEYTQPFKYILVLNNGKVTMKSEDSNNEFNMKGNAIFDQVNNLIIASVSGNILSIKDYELQVLENDNTYLVILKPMSQYLKDLINQMELFIDKQTYAVTKIRMSEIGSDFSLISFSNIRINEDIEDNIFTP